MFADKKNLGDNPSDWHGGFATNNIDGVILVAGDAAQSVEIQMYMLKKILQVDEPNGPVHTAFTLAGKVRPGDQDGHEQ